MRRVLQHLAQHTDRTIVLATPVPQLVEEVADRVILMRDGRIVAFDTISGLRRMTGHDESLQELYERLTNPQSIDNIHKYFEVFPE
jgi:ABC-type multidrug transport system ATPase subunit